MLGTIEPCDAPPDLTFARDAFRPEAGATALRAGDVTVMPTCDAPINLGFRSAPDASSREKIVEVRQSRLGGSSMSVNGLGESGDCREGLDDDMHSPLSVRWLDPPPPGGPAL